MLNDNTYCKMILIHLNNFTLVHNVSDEMISMHSPLEYGILSVDIPDEHLLTLSYLIYGVESVDVNSSGTDIVNKYKQVIGYQLVYNKYNVLFEHYLHLENEQVEEWKRYRRLKYPDITEFADAYVKQNGSIGDNTQMLAYIEQCESVKESIPKLEDINEEMVIDSVVRSIWLQWKEYKEKRVMNGLLMVGE